MVDLIIKRIERLMSMIDAFVSPDPEDAKFNVMLLSLKELKDEISKPGMNKRRMRHLQYGITRIYDDMLELENTAFGVDNERITS